MLWIIFAMLVTLWIIGLLSQFKLGGLIHLLVVTALAVVILQFITGRRRL
ncbi:MAG TPA: lmo0937 family membrane protein [Ignavibacteriaceae bacterium]|nr:lmo0937 family membrane protein [Ignavibacteriaceae bacterium]